MKKAVITAAGGVSALESWLRRQVKNCQWTHSDYHHHELVPFRHATGVIIACWHCDNELKNQTEQTLDQLVGVNNADWVIDTARIALGLDAQRSLSLAELCWWAVGAGIGDEITEEMARRSCVLKTMALNRFTGRVRLFRRYRPPVFFLPVSKNNQANGNNNAGQASGSCERRSCCSGDTIRET